MSQIECVHFATSHLCHPTARRNTSHPLRSQGPFMMQPYNARLSPQIYQICVHEELDGDMAAWFSPLEVKHGLDGTTTLTVSVRDQAELHGLLIKIRDLNLNLIAIIHL